MFDINTTSHPSRSITSTAAEASSHREGGHRPRLNMPIMGPRTNQLFHQADFETEEGGEESSAHNHHLPQNARPDEPRCVSCCIM
ncbi:hypothetical protein Syun_024834 [Stephania yunnanensis]|uniref:Uncharacterized protein n=1 Tax=Stephania yunnanensis TaxID=152371 RepID=A0AAP0EQY7_9MAGN